jgi:hypothetical protein
VVFPVNRGGHAGKHSVSSGKNTSGGTMKGWGGGPVKPPKKGCGKTLALILMTPLSAAALAIAMILDSIYRL